MKISKYIIVKQIGDDFILLSTISKKIIKVSAQFYNEMKNIDRTCLREINEEEIQYLIDAYFLLEDDVDERNVVEYLMDTDRINQQIFLVILFFLQCVILLVCIVMKKGKQKEILLCQKKLCKKQ